MPLSAEGCYFEDRTMPLSAEGCYLEDRMVPLSAAAWIPSIPTPAPAGVVGELTPTIRPTTKTRPPSPPLGGRKKAL